MKNKLLLSFLDSTLKNVEIQDEVQIQEKLLQNIVSTHIEKIFDAYLIWNEITFKQDNSLRLDTLWITKDWKLLIIEYKKNSFDNMLTQPLAYHSYLSKYRWDVILLIQQKEKELWLKLINWTELPEILIICVAQFFSNHDIEWSKSVNQPIWFYTYNIFSNHEEKLNLLMNCIFKNKQFELLERKVLIELTDKEKENYLNSMFEEIYNSNIFEQFWLTCKKWWNQYAQVYLVKDEWDNNLFSFDWYKNSKSYYLEITSILDDNMIKRLYNLYISNNNLNIWWLWKANISDYSNKEWEWPITLTFRIIEFWQHDLKQSIMNLLMKILLDE